MLIKSLALNNFRNIGDLKINFDSDLNILYGNNAQGKTNILESIYVSGTTKSHRGSKDREMINIDSDEGHIRLIIQKNEIERRIDVHLKKNKSKGIAVDGIPLRKFSEIFGLLQIVFFSPEDLNLIKSSPTERRRFIDMELSQIDKIYLYNITNYNKILVQRNNLLRQIQFNNELISTLEIWDEQLVKYGIEIIKSRREFIKELDSIIKSIHYNLTGGIENLDISYLPNVKEDEFLEKLKKSRQSELYQKTTLVGIQRDDIVFFINGKDAKKFGSQGQQRSVALSLKLSEIELFKRKTKESPILLLDDVFSELDRNRQNYLIENIGGIQTIITCTGLEEFVENKKNNCKIYKIVNGNIIK